MGKSPAWLYQRYAGGGSQGEIAKAAAADRGGCRGVVSIVLRGTRHAELLTQKIKLLEAGEYMRGGTTVNVQQRNDPRSDHLSSIIGHGLWITGSWMIFHPWDSELITLPIDSFRAMSPDTGLFPEKRKSGKNESLENESQSATHRFAGLSKVDEPSVLAHDWRISLR